MAASFLILALASATAPANDYRADAAWLCRPGRQDACESDLDETIVSPGGKTRRAPASSARPRDVDCFYVYPTVSLDPGGNSDMTAGRDERGMTTAQFAPFRTACRPFAPLYRQVTLTALRQRMSGAAADIDPDLPYRDVRDAFHSYLSRDNGGRPFVLVGQSQGAMLLKRLIAEEIDGRPIARRMLSAILPGTAVLVPPGKDIGGTFRTLPLCRADTQTGCIVSWASYRAGAVLPPNARFGTRDNGFGEAGSKAMDVACTNPARLAGGTAPLDAILGFPWWRGGVAQYERLATGWSVPGGALSTRFVRMPGLLAGECRRQGAAHYLAVNVASAGDAALADALVGPAAVGDVAYPDWGFHVIDMAVVEGDLVRLVRRQHAAWRTANRRPG